MSEQTFLTREGLKKLEEELNYLRTVRRAQVAERLHNAQEDGELIENAEYEDAKNEQAFVEGRILDIKSIIENAILIDEKHATDHVAIGSTVTVETNDGRQKFTIVGAPEADPRNGKISNESPVGRALLGHKKGEQVNVKVPAGDFAYKIVAIS